MIALECNGVIKYARGARSCAQQECRNIPPRIAKASGLMMPWLLFAILAKLLRFTIPPTGGENTHYWSRYWVRWECHLSQGARPVSLATPPRDSSDFNELKSIALKIKGP